MLEFKYSFLSGTNVRGKVTKTFSKMSRLQIESNIIFLLNDISGLICSIPGIFISTNILCSTQHAFTIVDIFTVSSVPYSRKLMISICTALLQIHTGSFL